MLEGLVYPMESAIELLLRSISGNSKACDELRDEGETSRRGKSTGRLRAGVESQNRTSREEGEEGKVGRRV